MTNPPENFQANHYSMGYSSEEDPEVPEIIVSVSWAPHVTLEHALSIVGSAAGEPLAVNMLKYFTDQGDEEAQELVSRNREDS